MSAKIGLVAHFLMILVLFTTALFGQSAAPPQSNLSAPTTPADTSAPITTPKVEPPRAPGFVPVLFSATDARGNPVLGLTKDQLTLLDTNQVVQPLQLYKGLDLPLHLGIVLLSSPRSFSQQQAAAIDLVNKVIRPGIDEAFVVTARGKKPWPGERLEWNKDPAELAKIIQNLDANAGLADAFNFDLQTSETGMDENAGRSTLQTVAGNGVSVFDVVYSMISSDPRPSRRVLLLFREPWAHSPGFGRRANTSVEGHLLRVIGVAQEMHIAAFVIGLEDPRFNGITDNNLGKIYTSVHGGEDGGAGSANREYDRQMEQARIRAYNAGRTNVERLAVETGGATYWSTKKNYSDAISAIANQLAGQYIVTFVPRDVPAVAHPLKITSKDGAHVLSQPVFFFGAR
jgi:VWFA-related protein